MTEEEAPVIYKFKARLRDYHAHQHALAVASSRAPLGEFRQVDEYAAPYDNKRPVTGAHVKLRTEYFHPFITTRPQYMLIVRRRRHGEHWPEHNLYQQRDVVPLTCNVAEVLTPMLNLGVLVDKTRQGNTFPVSEALQLCDSVVHISVDTVKSLSRTPGGQDYFIKVKGVLDQRLAHSGNACKSLRRYIDQLRAELGVSNADDPAATANDTHAGVLEPRSYYALCKEEFERLHQDLSNTH